MDLSSNEDRDGNYVPAGNYEAFVAYKDWMGREYSSSDRVPVTIRRFVYIHSGMHGPMAATDVEGDVVWRRSYEPFGGDGLFEDSSYEDTYNQSPGLVTNRMVSFPRTTGSAVSVCVASPVLVACRGKYTLKVVP